MLCKYQIVGAGPCACLPRAVGFTLNGLTVLALGLQVQVNGFETRPYEVFEFLFYQIS